MEVCTHTHARTHTHTQKKLFTVEHALSCPRGGFLFVRHNEIRDSIAHLLKKICHDVSVEPAWPSAIDWGSLSYHSVVVDDGAHLGTGLGGVSHQCVFFDVRVFNPYTPSYQYQLDLLSL